MPSTASPLLRLQVAVHPRGRESNVMGRPLSGPACVQLWEARFGGDDSTRCSCCMMVVNMQVHTMLLSRRYHARFCGVACLQGDLRAFRCRGEPGELVSTPTFAMAVCHDGGVAWDVKWCPHSPPTDDGGSATLPRCCAA
jgi:hypothetical protein